MPDTPYIISGTIKKEDNSAAASATVTFTTTSGSKVVTADSSGQYVLDLANIGYSSGGTVTYSALDKFNNETYSGSFTISGENKTENITLASRTSAIVPPGNRNQQIHSIGGKPVSYSNPFPITNTEELNGHPQVKGNVQTDWVITRSDGQPDSETVTFPDGSSYQRTYTYTGDDLTSLSRWVAQ